MAEVVEGVEVVVEVEVVEVEVVEVEGGGGGEQALVDAFIHACTESLPTASWASTASV